MDSHVKGNPDQDAQIQQQLKWIEDTVNYCRAKERQVKGFGQAMLDQICEKNNVPINLKATMKDLIDNPDKKFTPKFNKNESKN